MQPPTNFSAMPEFYAGNAYSMSETDEDPSGRVRRRSSSMPPNNGENKDGGEHQPGTFGGNLQTDIAKMAWEAGSSQVKRAFFLYTNIDLFRPYFDVEPKQVRNRLFQSLLPRMPASMQSMGADLYGPIMLIFTLVAILLYSMKTSGFQVKDGTLIGTAFFTCFTYWFFASMGVYALGYVFVSRIGMLQTFSILGYALFSHCLVLGVSSLAHHMVDSHATFYILFGIFGGLSSLRMAIFFASKTPARTHKFILASVVVAMHLGFLLYLHFGYEKVVEEINEMLGNDMLEPAAVSAHVMTRAAAPVVESKFIPSAPSIPEVALKQVTETLKMAAKNHFGKRGLTLLPHGGPAAMSPGASSS